MLKFKEFTWHYQKTALLLAQQAFSQGSKEDFEHRVNTAGTVLFFAPFENFYPGDETRT